MINKKAISIMQISIMIVATFAFAFILNSAFVSATDKGSESESETQGSSPYNYGEECLSLGGTCTSGYCSGDIIGSDCFAGTICCIPKIDSSLDSSAGPSDFVGKGAALLGIGQSGLSIWEKTKPAKDVVTEIEGIGAKLVEDGGTTGITSDLAAGPEKAMTVEQALRKPFFETTFAAITSIVVIAAAAAGLARIIAPEFGASVSQAQTLAYIAAGSTIAANILIWGQLGVGEGNVAILPGGLSIGKWILGTGASTFATTALTLGIFSIAVFAALTLFYKKEPVEVVQFNCLAWQPQSGGEFCEECNNGVLPCTEYQCKSLGRGCELINKGTEEEMCYYSYRLDVTPPVINVNKAEYDSDEIFLKPYKSTSQFPDDR
jgi:hypothetical protein